MNPGKQRSHQGAGVASLGFLPSGDISCSLYEFSIVIWSQLAHSVDTVMTRYWLDPMTDHPCNSLMIDVLSAHDYCGRLINILTYSLGESKAHIV